MTNEQFTDSQLLMLAALIDKMAHVERRVTTTESNGHVISSTQWEKYALSLLSVLFGVLSILFWDMRTELTRVRSTQDNRTKVIEMADYAIKSQEERAIKLVLAENRIKVIEDRTETMTKRILSLAERLDRAVPSNKKQDPPYHDY